MTITLAQPAPPKAPRSCCLNHPIYTAGCPDCREANAARTRFYNRQRGYGRWQGKVPAAEVLPHVQTLLAAEMTPKAISRAAGVGQDCIRNLLCGRTANLFPRTARKILDVHPTPPDNARVDSLAVSHWLQALSAIGWPTTILARELGQRVQQIKRWRVRNYPTIRYRYHRAVEDLYRRLRDTPGPCEQTRAVASRLGYVPPIPLVIRPVGDGRGCDGREPEAWTVGDPRNWEAMALCRQCVGCPESWGPPLGMIRDGIPYSDKGRPLPPCPTCGLPNADYRGGNPAPCSGCADTPVVSVAAHRDLITRLWQKEGKTPAEIAAEIGSNRRAVSKAIERWKLRRNTGQVAA